MKIKAVLWSVALIVIIGLGAGAYCWSQRPQVIMFGDGDKLTLLGVDYGKRHVPPIKKTKSQTGQQDGSPNTFNTYKKALVVWVRQEHDPKKYQNFQYFLYDQAGTACAQSSGMNSGNRNNQQGSEIVAIQFNSFPRRKGKCVLRAQKYGPQGPEMAAGEFVIRNPVRGPFTTSWKAESLPATKEDGDLSVTLLKLDAGADSPYAQNQGDDEGKTKAVEATFQVQRNGKPVMNWQPTSVVSSDVTGNSVNMGVNQNTWKDNTDVVVYQSGLWPDEPVWKVQFEFAQQSGFASNEMWSVSNIPIEPGLWQDFYNSNGRRNTNVVFAETDMDGIHLKIYPAKQFTDQQQGNGQINGGFKIQATPSLPAGMQMTLVVTDNKGEEFQLNGSGSTSNGKYTVNNYQLQDIGGLTNINVTIGLHRNRFVEFTVKPK